MTKKELIESEYFKELPDDAEIVFATDELVNRCVPLNALNISIVSQCVNIPKEGDVLFRPEYKTALLIDAIPYWYLKEGYGITLKSEVKSES